MALSFPKGLAHRVQEAGSLVVFLVPLCKLWQIAIFAGTGAVLNITYIRQCTIPSSQGAYRENLE